jgi:hypothetical protein
MPARILIFAALVAGLLISGCSKKSSETAKPPQASKTNQVRKASYPKSDDLQVVDLSKFYKGRIGGSASKISGLRIVDGLPFHIGGMIYLYGQNEVDSENSGKPQADAGSRYPDKLGIPVGREFEELHLIHTTAWPDVEGETIALIRLHYDDGTTYEFPILYGGHVRDIQRIQTEESETLSDPDSKIIWRGPGVANYKSTSRVFKSRLINPHPEKMVKTMDVVSTHHLAAYQLLAATVADSDFKRAITPPVPADEPARHFDDELTVQVRDEATGQPVKGALVRPDMDVDGPYMVAAPFYTSETGEGVIRYPKSRINHLSLEVEMKGYANGYAGWSGDYPATNTIQLTPAPAP